MWVIHPVMSVIYTSEDQGKDLWFHGWEKHLPTGIAWKLFSMSSPSEIWIVTLHHGLLLSQYTAEYKQNKTTLGREEPTSILSKALSIDGSTAFWILDWIFLISSSVRFKPH